MKHLILFAFLSVLVSCSSGPKKAEDLEKTYDSRTTDKQERVGVRDDEIVIQKRTSLEERLFELRGEVEDLQKSVYGRSRKEPGGMWERLRACRKNLADPRIGGKGVPEKMESWENVADKDDEFEYRVNKKETRVVGVSEEKLSARISRLKTHKRMLEKKYSEFEEKIEVCQAKYRTALLKHGINPDDAKAEGEWVQGPGGYKVWRMKKRKTSDPEEMRKRQKQRESK